MFILKAVSQLQIIEEVASQYGLAALMQEKPFAVSLTSHITPKQTTTGMSAGRAHMHEPFTSDRSLPLMLRDVTR